MPRRVLALTIVVGLLFAACDESGDPAEPTPTLTDEPSATVSVTATATRTTTPSITPTRPPPSATRSVVNAVAPSTSTPQPSSPPPRPPSGGGPQYGHPTNALSLPAGFRAFIVAEGFSSPTSISVSGGAIYVSERYGTIYRLLDLDVTGYFEVKRRFASGYSVTTGIMAAAAGTLYVSHTGHVTIVRDTNGDTVGDTSQAIISGLPNGRHQNNGLAFGPNGKLYITNGSTCDDCVEANGRSATVLESNANGSGLRVFARGLRNTYDIAFDFSGRMWGTDNGSDTPCATIDELNMIRDGGNYGWPYRPACNPYADGILPSADLGLHTAATGIELYDGRQFPGYNGSLFLTLWNTTRMLRAVPGGQPAQRASGRSLPGSRTRSMWPSRRTGRCSCSISDRGGCTGSCMQGNRARPSRCSRFEGRMPCAPMARGRFAAR